MPPLHPQTPQGEVPVWRRGHAVGPNAGVNTGQTTSDTPGPATPILPAPQPPNPIVFRTDTFIPIFDPIPVYYGAFRAGGQLIVNQRTAAGGKLYAWVVCLGEIHQFTSILVENKSLAFWGATSAVYLGSPSQTTDSILSTNLGARLSQFGAGIDPKTGIGLAYVVAQFPPPSPTQADAPDPYQFIVQGEGMLVYDPTLGVDSTTNIPTHAKVYSDNPYLCRADWRAASTGAYGCCQPVSSIDWTGTVTSSAAAADVDIGGGTKRFRIAAAINTGGDPYQEDENMRVTCQGLAAVYNNGLWQFPIDIARASTGILLTDQGTEANLVSAGPLIIAGPNEVKTRVRVSFTDVANLWKVDTTPPDDDPGIALGTAPVEDYTVPGQYIPTYDQAVRIGRYYRKRSGMDKSFPFVMQPDGIQLLPGDRFQVTSTEINTSNLDAVCTDIGPIPNSPAGQWQGRAEYYDATLYDDTKASTTGYAPPAVLSPYDTPPTPPAPTLVQEGFNIRVTLNALSPAYPWLGGQIITVQQAGFAERELGRPTSGDLLIQGVTMGTLYTVRAKVVSSLFPLLVGVAASATITPTMAQAPDVVNAKLNISGATPPVVSAYWDTPVYLAANLYGASFWSQTGAGGFVAANVNDGNTGVKAFDWNVASDTTNTIDFGVGVTKNIRSLRVYCDTSGIGMGVVEYSDNGSGWTPVANQRLTTLNPPAVISGSFVFSTDIGWSDPGSHRLFRWRKGFGTAFPANFSEMQWFEVTGPATIDHFDIFDASGNPVTNLDVSALPTVANPWVLPATLYTYTRTSNGSGSFSTNFTIRAVPTAGAASTGITLQTISFYSALSVGLTLANGLNSNIAIASYANVLTYGTLIDASGPTTAFSLGGFDSGYSAKTLTVVNRTGQAMTIVNEDASSTAANRITTQTGANVALASPGVASFVYDGAASRWELTSTNSPNPVINGSLRVLQTTSSLTNNLQFGDGTDGYLASGTSGVFLSNKVGAPLLDFDHTTKRANFAGPLVVGGGTPAVAFVVSGFGTGATIALGAGGSDAAGTITITAGTGAGSTGSVRVTFSAALGTNPPTVSLEMVDGTGAWDQRVTKKLINSTPTTAKFEAFFDNNGVAFTNGSTYKFSYQVIGKP